MERKKIIGRALNSEQACSNIKWTTFSPHVVPCSTKSVRQWRNIQLVIPHLKMKQKQRYKGLTKKKGGNKFVAPVFSDDEQQQSLISRFYVTYRCSHQLTEHKSGS